MKILMLIDSLAYGGGAERQFSGLAIALHRAGYKIKVIAYHNNDGYQKEFDDIGIPYTILKKLSSKIKLILLIKKEIKAYHPDIVISYKDSPNKIACILKALGSKWKLIVSDRNTLQNLSKSVILQYKFLYRFANVIVPNSFSQKNFIDTHFPFLKKRTFVITNFTDISTFHPKIHPTDKSSVCTILVVARIAKQKNVKRFIEAANILVKKWKKTIKIVWYGRINVNEESYGYECRELVKKYALDDYFLFREPVKNINEIYQKSDFFCLPSLWEGFPNALCEAMSSGLVVAASRICDNESIIYNGINGLLFNPYDPEDIARTLNTILSLNQDDKNLLSKNARNYALTHLSIESFLEKYISLINNILS